MQSGNCQKCSETLKLDLFLSDIVANDSNFVLTLWSLLIESAYLIPQLGVKRASSFNRDLRLRYN
jgi:hypothetical protein